MCPLFRSRPLSVPGERRLCCGTSRKIYGFAYRCQENDGIFSARGRVWGTEFAASDQEKQPITPRRTKKAPYPLKGSKLSPIDRARVRTAMVVTPWGESDRCGNGGCRPAPGRRATRCSPTSASGSSGRWWRASPTRGYRATTVGDLVEISGVSSRTFYDLFPDKKACFLATLEAMIEAAIAYAARQAGELVEDPAPGGVTLPEPEARARSWEERAGQGLRAFAEMIVAQPAAARLAPGRGLHRRARGAGAAGTGDGRLRMADPAGARAVAASGPGCRRRW